MLSAQCSVKGKGVNFRMRFVIIFVCCVSVSIAKAQRTPQIELSLSVDTSGNCISVLTGKYYGILYVEQFRWNRWCPVDTLGDQSWSDTTIQSKVIFHSGENQFRAVAVPANPYISKVNSKVTKVTTTKRCHTVSRCNGQYLFGCNTFWEVTTFDGILVEHGYGDKVNLMAYPEGRYYLNYDNNSLMFFGNREKD